MVCPWGYTPKPPQPCRKPGRPEAGTCRALARRPTTFRAPMPEQTSRVGGAGLPRWNDRSCSPVGRRLKGVREFSVVQKIANSDVVPASGRIARAIAPPCSAFTPVELSSRDIVRHKEPTSLGKVQRWPALCTFIALRAGWVVAHDEPGAPRHRDVRPYLCLPWASREPQVLWRSVAHSRASSSLAVICAP